MDTDNFIFHVKSKNIYKDIAEDVETRNILKYTDHYLKERMKK